MTQATVQTGNTQSMAGAARALAQGGLVAFPTETVYGLGADATNDRAVAALFAAKNRPQFNPLIVHVASLDEAQQLVEFTPLARDLAARFWPGALTLVLPRKAATRLSLLVTAGLDTAAIRVPSQPVAQQLLRAARLPIAAPSANASGEISPTTAEHVRQSLGDKVDIILDGGPTLLGLESTVIGFANEKPVLLRPGAIPREALESVAGKLGAPPTHAIVSPGQLSSHYAPRAQVRLNASRAEPGELLLGFGPAQNAARNLSERGDLQEAAANLFAMLHALDAQKPEAIAVMPIPDKGLGEAINDRLRRAAAPRQRRA
ncbi:MAG TPA: L-threonylcarbamoyladenylate synthase [Rhizomicrobium sp.]|nr:L-threonylcarbamoyladenylate synthase [Rhizomicrobium sp.]